jgi:hypothetical protein
MTESDLERPVKERVLADNDIQSPEFQSLMDPRFRSSSTESDTPSQDEEDPRL